MSVSFIQSLLKSKLPAIAWTIIIFVLCTIPSKEVAKIGSINDKTSHLIAFGGFVFFWLFHTNRIGLMLLLGCFYGILIEFWQSILPETFHREFDWLDAVADSIGCLLGYFIYLIFNYLSKKISDN